MFPAYRFIAAAIVTALFIAGCGGAATTSMPSQPRSAPVQPYSGPSQFSNFTWGAQLMSKAQYVGPVQVGSLSVDVMLQAQDLPGLLQYAKMASDPASPLYRRFLTPEQIGQRFGATERTSESAAKYFHTFHLGVGTWPQRLVMVVSGNQGDMEHAFGTKFGLYREYGRTFVAPMQQPHFSAVVPVSGVTGLVHANLEKNFFMRAGNGNFLGMSGAQIKRAFDFTGAASAGYTGAGINVGIIGTGPISSADTAAIQKLSNVPVAPVTLVQVIAQAPSLQNNQTGTGSFDDPTGLAPPPPVTAPCAAPAGFVLGTATAITCNPEDGEAQLDTEQAAQLAPGSNVLFYLAYNNKDCAELGVSCVGLQGLYLWNDEVQQAIADNTVDALSISVGQDEPSAQSSNYFDTTGAGVGPAEMAALASEGIAVFVSSGDSAAHACVDSTTGAPTNAYCVFYPASDPSVVAVGGVNYPMDSTGNLAPNAQITAWAYNTTLGGDGIAADNGAGSGGGISQFFSSPVYQSGLPAIIQGTAIGGKRVLPDVAMLADPLTGPLVVMNAAFPGQASAGAGGGTSASAPEMAAEWAVVLQACKVHISCASAGGAHPWRLGNPNSLLYQIYGNTAKYTGTFYDVTAGNNGAAGAGATFYPGYQAGTGYDLVTGMGVPFVGHLINSIIPGTNIP